MRRLSASWITSKVRFCLIGAIALSGCAHSASSGPAPLAAAKPTECIVPSRLKPMVQNDRDHDGVPDDSDLCPDKPGSPERYGCPAYKRIFVRREKIELQEHILFATDKAVIDPVSHPLLDEVVDALNDNRSFHVRIEGHTDSVGGDARNQPLSEQRAQAVLWYLVDHGVNEFRLRSMGFGSTMPIATNDTDAGRDTNRRVEFMVDIVALTDATVR